MAVSLLSHDVSDLCIGKPPLKPLPASATVAEAICALKSPTTAEAYISISGSVGGGGSKAVAIAGKVCMVDVLCYLCSSEHISSPVAALEKPVSVLLPKDSARGGIRRIDFNSSISEALDVMIDGGNHSLIVPIRRRREGSFCWLTEEDLLRFFLNSIFLFSSIASLSVTSLGLVRAAVLSIRCHEPALSALALIRSALDDCAAVAVVMDDGKLVGEISPSTLSTCDETVAAAIAALSAGELMAYIDCCSGGVLTESVVDVVKTRLREKGMPGMIQFIEEETISSLQSSSSTSSSSSSSDDESEAVSKRRRPRRTKSGSYSTRMGRRSEEAIVCHPESSLVAVMVQALAHRVSYIWVVDDEYGLVGVVTFPDLLRVFREEVGKA